MDAKTKANFINSVASGSQMECPKCGTVNEAGSNFCSTCGTVLEWSAPKVQPKTIEKYIEPESVFAKGLPAWSIEPPQVVVRRRRAQ